MKELLDRIQELLLLVESLRGRIRELEEGFIHIPAEKVDLAWDGGRRPPTEYSDGFDAALNLLGITRCYKCGDSDRPVDPDRLCSGCYRGGKNRGWTIY